MGFIPSSFGEAYFTPADHRPTIESEMCAGLIYGGRALAIDAEIAINKPPQQTRLRVNPCLWLASSLSAIGVHDHHWGQFYGHNYKGEDQEAHFLFHALSPPSLGDIVRIASPSYRAITSHSSHLLIIIILLQSTKPLGLPLRRSGRRPLDSVSQPYQGVGYNGYEGIINTFLPRF